jgi:hypothetical protein
LGTVKDGWAWGATGHEAARAECRRRIAAGLLRTWKRLAECHAQDRDSAGLSLRGVLAQILSRDISQLSRGNALR